MIFINKMHDNDWKQVANIYQEGIDTKIATFQPSVPTWEEWDQRHCQHCRLVARNDTKVLGWTALSPVSSRCVYSGVAEVSLYVGENARHQNIGTTLLKHLISSAEKEGYWTLQASITKGNDASIKMCQKCGFRVVGIREKLGQMPNGEWKDIISVEYRSKTIGV